MDEGVLPLHQQRYRRESRYADGLERRLRCRKCGLILRDGEPFTRDGEFHHQENGCPNGGITFRAGPREGRRVSAIWSGRKKEARAVSGIEVWMPKTYRRALRRGARAARKYRPR